MKKNLFARLIAPLAFVAAVIFAGCSDPSTSNADVADVPRGSVIKATYSDVGGGTQVAFKEDGTVDFLDNGGARVRAAADIDGNVCARGTYVVTADNIARITITEVLRGWGDLTKEKLESYNEREFAIKVEFSGNDLSITIDENDERPLSFSFSTDKKDVSKPSGSKPPVQDENESSGIKPPVQSSVATYVVRETLILENGKFSSTKNIDFEYDTEDPFEGTYTQSGNTITLKLNSPVVWGDEVAKATAIISGSTLTLTIYYKESDGEGHTVGTSTEETVFKKRSDTEWESSSKVEFHPNLGIKYYENDALCWEGKYTIINDETASVKVEQIHIKDSFGTAPGNLFIEDASQDFLDLDLHESEGGGVAIRFAREK